MSIEQMQKSRMRDRILTTVINLVYIVSYIVFLSMQKYNRLAWVVFAAFTSLTLFYVFYVVFLFLPAVKKLKYLTEQRRDLLCQFWVFLVAFLVKMILTITYILYRELHRKGMSPVLGIPLYFASFIFTDILPVAYMLYSH